MKSAAVLKNLLSATAWEMIPPRPYSVFHLTVTVIGLLLSVQSAFFLARRRIRPEAVLFSCGLSLFLMELYKQAFLFFVEFEGSYDWWYFPFQLCSIPMYLCLLYPLTGKNSAAISTFVQDFGLLGGIMALAVPAGLMHPYWTMTLHGFLWHFLLVFLGVYCARAGITDLSLRGFLKTLPVYFVCCLTALAVNAAAGPASDADMFYISPYHPSSQPVFHRISLIIGIFPGILLYLASVAAGAFLIHRIISILLPHPSSAGRRVR